MSRILRTTVLAGLASAALATGAGVAHAAPPLAEGTEGLEPGLAVAYTLAHDEAARQGVELSVTSGYRSWAEQEQLWQEGLVEHGSPEEAQKWVLPPDRSTHVTGQALDLGPQSGAEWLEVNGNRWGLCRPFDNEWWHFEVLTVPGTPCPPRVPDAAHRTPTDPAPFFGSSAPGRVAPR